MPIFRILGKHKLTITRGNKQFKLGPYPFLTRFWNLPQMQIKNAQCEENLRLINLAEENHKYEAQEILAEIYSSSLYKENGYYIHSAIFHHVGRLSLRLVEFVIFSPLVFDLTEFYVLVWFPMTIGIRWIACSEDNIFGRIYRDRSMFYHNIKQLENICDGKPLSWQID